MCTIDKMLIKGIRSFSPDNQMVVEFYKPLTLIVGHNGAGKTTIIECLKQACTGELPPNTRNGQSFIHDPKVAGETEVKAQIKLRFRTATSQPVVVIRTFQLTQKKTALQFKTLDQTLQTFNRETGQKQALSYRCADIDRIVPSLMGVSKAILENVIFVHQEDSNWPLSDGQTLKKKFDDIFAATKYTKALQEMRKLRTEKTAEVKEFRLRLEHLKTHKDHSTKLKSDIAEGQEKDRNYMTQINQFEQEVQAFQQSMDELSAKLSAMADLNDELKQVKTKHEMTAKQNADMFIKLQKDDVVDDLDSSMEEFQAWIQEMDTGLRDLQRDLGKLDRDVLSKKQLIEANKAQYTRDVRNQGRLAAEAEQHARDVKERNRFMRQIAAQSGVMQLPGDDSSLSGAVVTAFNDSLNSKLKALTNSLQQLKDANRKQDDEQGRLIDQVTSETSGVVEGLRMKQQSIKQKEGQAQQLRGQMESCAVSKAMLDDIKAQEASCRAAVERAQDKLKRLNLDAEVAKHQAALDDLQRRASALRQERDTLTVAAEGATRLRIKNQEILAKEEQVRALLASNRAKLDSLLGTRGKELPRPDRMKVLAEQAVARKKTELQNRSRELQQVQGKASSNEGILRDCRADLNLKRNEMDDLRHQLKQGLSRVYGQAEQQEDPSVAARQMEEHKAERVEKLQRVKALGLHLNHNKRFAETEHKCCTCDRPLNPATELQPFLSKQDYELDMLPGSERKLESSLKDVQTKLEVVKQLQPLWLRLQALRDIYVPALQRKADSLDADSTHDTQRLEELQADYALLEHELQEGQRVQTQVVWQAEQLHRECQERKQEVDQLRHSAAASSLQRSVGDVDNDLDSVEADKAVAERAKDELLRKQSRLRNEITSANDEWHKVREEKLRANNLAQQRADLQSRIVELESECSSLQQQVQQDTAKREPLDAKKRQYLSEREAHRAAARRRESESETSLREMHNLSNQLNNRSQPIQEYLAQNKAEALQRLTAELDACKKRQDKLEAEVQELEAKRTEKDEYLKGQDEVQRQLNDCITYKRNKQAEDDLGKRIDQLGVQIRDIGDHSALAAQHHGLQDRKHEVKGRQDMMRGSLQTIRDGVRRAQRDLASPNYRDIDARYRKQLIELKTTEMANSDLDKYHKALEKALLTFHTTKMSDINKIIKELWQKTYRNQDIDYIQVKADAESGQRSYNYRVAMISGGAELDMRGRCSAGQKVLACLIIRLALAETFCLNCGILALDEPTTNLDAENSASLAEALRNIMMTRREQENFQLVIITHDERFAHMIGTREHADHLWRITKDANQHSHIAQEDLLE
ncbi:DNA repair protein rad50 [Trebouxia sp. C0009 RCD-2024]